MTAAREQKWEWEGGRGQPTLLPDKQQQQQQQTSLAAHCARHLRRIRIMRERQREFERARLRESAAGMTTAQRSSSSGSVRALRRVAFACRVGRAISFIYCMHKGDRVVKYPVTLRECTSVYTLHRYNANVPLSRTKLPYKGKEHSVGHKNSAICNLKMKLKINNNNYSILLLKLKSMKT